MRTKLTHTSLIPVQKAEADNSRMVINQHLRVEYVESFNDFLLEMTLDALRWPLSTVWPLRYENVPGISCSPNQFGLCRIMLEFFSQARNPDINTAVKRIPVTMRCFFQKVMTWNCRIGIPGQYRQNIQLTSWQVRALSIDRFQNLIRSIEYPFAESNKVKSR